MNLNEALIETTMKQSFEEFIHLIDKSVERDPWAKDNNIDGYCKDILDETNEALEALEKKDYGNLKEELGDILADWAHVCMLAEKQGLFTIKEIFLAINEKIKRRKPFILEKEKRGITKEEARRIWLEAKEEEKKARLKNIS